MISSIAHSAGVSKAEEAGAGEGTTPLESEIERVKREIEEVTADVKASALYILNAKFDEFDDTNPDTPRD